MFKLFSLEKPGPTDLTWDDKNSPDYLYRSADLSALEKTSPEEKREPAEQIENTEAAKVEKK